MPLHLSLDKVLPYKKGDTDDDEVGANHVSQYLGLDHYNNPKNNGNDSHHQTTNWSNFKCHMILPPSFDVYIITFLSID